MLQVVIGVRYPELGKKTLESLFWRVSDPTDAAWAQHVSAMEADNIVRPPLQDTNSVVEWLANASCVGDIKTHPGGAWVFGVASVACAEQLFGGVKYYQFSNGKDVVHRIEGKVNLPSALQSIVDVVAPTTRFPSPILPIRHTPATFSSASKLLGTNPTSIRSQYGLGDIQANNTKSGNSQQVTGFLKQYADQGDLQLFFDEYYKVGKGRRFSVVGPNPADDGGVEADLDVQYIMSIGSNVPTVFWSTPGERPYQNEPFVDWLTAVTALNDTALPNTISVSYGDNEYQIEPDYAAKMDVEFQKLAVRGTSIMFASGDGGVSGGQSGPCRPGNVFVPTFPAGSPFLTSVGSTDATHSAAASFSSGGFSNFYAAQPYQQKIIANYKATATGLPDSKHYNQTGRGFPDVSTVGENFWIFCQGLDQPVDGTSCSAPTFSGIVSLLNDARISAGKRPLGYLNQIFYQHPEVFTDIVKGSNPGCGTRGFPAAVGWDPVTGLGTPKFPALLDLVLSLP